MNTELCGSGICVLTACPGQIDTSFRERASSHFPQKKDRVTLPIQKAVALLLRQIETKKAVEIFDWRYRCLVTLGRLLPRKWIQAVLKNSLKDRYETL